MSPASSASDPAFWRAGAISMTIVMLVVLVFLTVDSLEVIREGGAQVPAYTVINREIGYAYDADAGYDKPVIGGEQLLFDRPYTELEARALIEKGKLVIQSRACMDCHTFFGNGAYYGPDLTKAWLDPAWERTWMPMTQQKTREGAMAEFLMHPETYPTWSRMMPNLSITWDEAVAVVAYLKWMSAVDANGFPANFGMIRTASAGPQASPEALAAHAGAPAAATGALTERQLMAEGKKAYLAQCAACHQANGLGVAGTFPPLAAGQPFSAAEPMLAALAERGFYKDGKIVEGPLKQHIDIVLHGIPGTPMPAFGAQLEDPAIAAIVTFERNSFGNHAGAIVQADAIAAARAGR
ncbi:MAG: cytochrome c [Burkholderiales bacterium]|nr:cytochrome c [Burkholderiales bacterium]